MIQQAITQEPGPIFEVGFSESSHGYRPGRSALVAVAEMQSGWKEGRRQVVECDLKSFFDTVNHDRLMEALREKITCRKTLGLLRRILSASVVLPDGPLEATAPSEFPKAVRFDSRPALTPSGLPCGQSISLRSIRPCWPTLRPTHSTRNWNAPAACRLP